MKKDILINLKELLNHFNDKKFLKKSISFIITLNILFSLVSSSKAQSPYERIINSISYKDVDIQSLINDLVTYAFEANKEIIKIDYVNPFEDSHAFTNEEKVRKICKKYKLTEEEFKVLAAIVMAECKRNDYTDAYAVINTIYNRAISYSWLKSVCGNLDLDPSEVNLYYHAINTNQFEVYSNGNYKDFLEVTEGDAYQAIIDFLYNEEPMHNYLNFLSASYTATYREQFVEGGNNYSNTLKSEDTIPVNERYFNIKEEQKYTLHVS